MFLDQRILCKIKSLVKKSFDIDPSLKVEKVSEEVTEQFLKEVEESLPDFYSMQLNLNSKEVSDNVAGYIACTSEKLIQNCYLDILKSENQALKDHIYQSYFAVDW